jgi:hypothetical protein
MAVTALLKFTQGATVGGDGRALKVSAGTAVTIENSDNTNVASWKIELLYAPPGGPQVVTPGAPTLLAEGNTGTPTVNITPDAGYYGSYRIRLTVWDMTGQMGASDVDIRNICVPTPLTEFFIPPFQEEPEPLDRATKPSETNYDGQLFGWDGDDRSKQLYGILLSLDGVLTNPITNMQLGSDTPYATAGLIRTGAQVGDIIVSRNLGNTDDWTALRVYNEFLILGTSDWSTVVIESGGTLDLIAGPGGAINISGNIQAGGYDILSPGLIGGYDLAGFPALQTEPTGFPNKTDTTLSRVDGTRTFTIAPTGASFDVYVKGVKYTKSSPENVVWTDTEGVWVFYYDDSGVLQATNDIPTVLGIVGGQGAITAALYWSVTDAESSLFLEERHGVQMDAATHIYLHETRGTQYITGGSLGNIVADGDGSSATHAQLSVGATTIADEDNTFSFSDGSPQDLDPIAQIPVFYRFGATGTWRRKTADDYPLIYSGTAGYTGASGRAPHNQWTGATWQLTEVNNNDYFLVHYYATVDLVHPIIGIQGQGTYGTLNAAREGAEDEIANIQGVINLLSTEYTPLGTVIYQTSSYANVPQLRIRPPVANAHYAPTAFAREQLREMTTSTSGRRTSGGPARVQPCTPI